MWEQRGQILSDATVLTQKDKKDTGAQKHYGYTQEPHMCSHNYDYMYQMHLKEKSFNDQNCNGFENSKQG